MPALVAFGRKWEIGSDDLVYPVFTDVFIRLPWLVTTIVIYWKNGSDIECPGKQNVQIFIYGVLAILHLTLLADLALAYNSMKGGIMDTAARRFVPLFLYIRTLVLVLELGWNILGTVWELKEGFDCDNSADTLTVIQGVLITNWIVIIFAIFYWIYQFDPYGSSKNLFVSGNFDENEFGVRQMPDTLRSSAWARKWRLLCCFTGGEASSKEIQDGFKEIGKLFSYTLNGRDLVRSDIIAGFVILAVKNKEIRRQKESSRTIPYNFRASINYCTKSEAFVLPATDDWNSIKNIIYFYDYAYGIFTIPASYCHNKRDFCCMMYKNMQCCNCLPGRKKYPFEADSDTCCYSKSAALRTFVDHDNMVYVSYDNANFKLPFFVAVDHLKHKIVIVVRGSFSCIDFVVDGICSPAIFNVPGIPEHFEAHTGMLTSAKLIHKQLKELEILKKLKVSYPDYEILFTGISLGAGVSTLLSMIVRVDYPTTKCIAFSPPAALLSKDAAEYCNEFVTSLVYSDDMVPRFNMKSFFRIYNQIEAVLAECTTPKYQINMGLGLFALGLKKMRVDFANRRKTTNMTGSLHATKQESITEEGSDAALFPKNELCSTIPNSIKLAARQASLEAIPEMYGPGKILYITQTPLHRKGKGKLSHPNGPRWEIRWAERSEFREVIVSTRMVLDHFPFRLMKAFTFFSKLEDEHGLGRDNNDEPILPCSPDTYVYVHQ